MPNWCEGTLKIRGSDHDILKFIKEGLNMYVYETSFNFIAKQVVASKSLWLKTGTDKFGNYINILDRRLYIEGTDRAFIRPKEELLIYNEDIGNYICLNFEQAWDIRSADWVNLSKHWNLDFRLYGIERGGQFCREVEVIDGKLTLDKTIKYDDWDWECPFPELGG